MDFKTSDNVNLHYSDTGDTDKPTMLGIPGIGGSSQMWTKVIALFKDKFRFIVLDPRNQGSSERTYKGQRISRHAADVEELLANLDLTNVIGIGNSMGASNLWSYLSIYGSGRFSAIVDLDQSPKMIADKGWPYGFKDLTWDNYPDYLKLNFGKAFYNHIDDSMFNKAKQENAKHPYNPDDNYKCLINHAEEDWRDVLMDTQLPMLVLAGKNSPFFDYHFTEAVKALNEKMDTEVISNCGHLIQAEQPVKMHDAIMKFLTKNSLL